MGQNSQTTQQAQSQQTQPWAPAIPGLQNLIRQISGGGAPLTGDQSGAVNALQAQAGQVPSFGAAGTGAVNNLFNTTTAPQVGMLGDAYKAFQAAQSPYLNPNYTNPYTNPALKTAIGTMNEDITNQINSEFAASGRSGSPANTKALARGLAQGEGGLLANEYNTLVGQQEGAAGSLLSGAGSTAGQWAGLNQIPLQNATAGIQAAGAVPGLWTMPGATRLTAANVGQQLPFQNLQLPVSMMMGLGGLGGQGMSTGTSTMTQPVNPWTTAAGAGLGLWALSDARLKEDIEPVGLLRNGLNVYRYRFKGSPKTEVGLMAQEVEKVRPDAVVDIGLWRGGPKFKAVDYAKATEPTAMAA